MSKALMCDNCGETLPLNARGEADSGEDAAWLTLHGGNQRWDLCTRSCVVAFLEREDVVAALDEWTESITGIARAIQEGRDDQDDEEADR